MSNIILTDEQKQIINFEPYENGTLLVSAYAGAAKTFTLFEYAKKRQHARILYLAFNKAMAVEAQGKFKSLPNVDAKTIHSLAFRFFGVQYKHRLGNLRAYNLIEHKIVDSYAMATTVLEIFNAYVSSSSRCILEFVSNYNFKHVRNTNKISEHVSCLWDKVTDIKEDIAVPHDVYLKLFQLNNVIIPYDYILVDEAQDITDCVIDIVSQQYAKKIFVGDSFQQIYSWKYAVNSLEKLKNSSEVLYLTKSFRCPQYVADYANSYLELLGAEKEFKGTSEKVETSNQTAAIARCNGTLFDLAAELNLDKIKIHFLGGFWGYNFGTIVDIRRIIDQKTNYIKDPFLKQFSNIEKLEEYINDSNEIDLQTRLYIARKYKNISYIYQKLKRNHTENINDSDIVLTTAHKVKGQEFSSIHILDDFKNIYEESVVATRENPVEFKKEELNLLYVAMTRTRDKIECPDTYILSETQKSLINRKIQSQSLVLV